MAARLKMISATKAVSTTGIPLSATDLWVRQLVILNPSGGSTVYIGDSAVSDATSFPIAAASSLAIDPNQALVKNPQQVNLKDIYVICAAAGSANLKLLYMVEEFDQVAPV